MRIRTQCRACGLPYQASIGPGQDSLPCPGCLATTEIAAAGWTDGDDSAVDVCPLCGCAHLYRQRDFNRALGCLLVLVGAALVPWTYGLSLIALSAVDFWLYYRLKESVVCYKCDTVYRDAIPRQRQTPVDLLKHDIVKYGKSWTELEEEPAAQRGSESTPAPPGA